LTDARKSKEAFREPLPKFSTSFAFTYIVKIAAGKWFLAIEGMARGSR